MKQSIMTLLKEAMIHYFVKEKKDVSPNFFSIEEKEEPSKHKLIFAAHDKRNGEMSLVYDKEKNLLFASFVLTAMFNSNRDFPAFHECNCKELTELIIHHLPNEINVRFYYTGDKQHLNEKELIHAFDYAKTGLVPSFDTDYYFERKEDWQTSPDKQALECSIFERLMNTSESFMIKRKVVCNEIVIYTLDVELSLGKKTLIKECEVHILEDGRTRFQYKSINFLSEKIESSYFQSPSECNDTDSLEEAMANVLFQSANMFESELEGQKVFLILIRSAAEHNLFELNLDVASEKILSDIAFAGDKKLNERTFSSELKERAIQLLCDTSDPTKQSSYIQSFAKYEKTMVLKKVSFKGDCLNILIHEQDKKSFIEISLKNTDESYDIVHIHSYQLLC